MVDDGFVGEADGLIARIGSLHAEICERASLLTSQIAGRWIAEQIWESIYYDQVDDRAWFESFLEERRVAEDGTLRTTSCDLTITVAIWAHPRNPQRQVVAQIMTDHDEFSDLVSTALLLERYPYWDDDIADRPVNVSADQWTERRDVWHEVLTRRSGGLTHYVMPFDIDEDIVVGEMYRYGKNRLGLTSVDQARAIVRGEQHVEVSLHRRCVIEEIKDRTGDTSVSWMPLSYRDDAPAGREDLLETWFGAWNSETSH